MNDQHRRAVPFSARQIVPGHLSYRQLSPGQLSYPRAGMSLRRLVKGMSVAIIVSLLLVLMLELVLHLNQQGQQPAHATHVALSSQDALLPPRSIPAHARGYTSALQRLSASCTPWQSPLEQGL